MGSPGSSSKITVSISGEGVEFKQDSFPAGTSVRQVLEKFGISSENVELSADTDKVELDAMLTKDIALVVKKT